MALSGRYGFVDALAMFNSCDNIRRVYDHWIRQIDTPLVHIMSLPRKAEPAQVDWFYEELENLKHLLESHFDVRITVEGLGDAIRLHNRARGLLRTLYNMRKADAPPITGAEALAVTVAGTAMPKARYVELLEEVIEDARVSGGDEGHKPRLMVLGGILDDPRFVEVIEGQGAVVVTDSLCFGSRLFWEDVNEESGDPLRALARYYVADRPSCPRVFGLYESRIKYVTDMVRDFRVDGVVIERLAFCDLWGFEQFTISNDLRELNIPHLMLDREYTLSGIGQVRTRMQAFLETIRG